MKNKIEIDKDEQDETIESKNHLKDVLWDADPNCDHNIVALWSGIKCSKCGGWFCY